MTLVPLSAITRRVRNVYERIDPQLEKQAAEHGATCQRKCAACCHQRVGLTFAEALTIAEALVEAAPLVDKTIEIDGSRRLPGTEIARRLERLDAAAMYGPQEACVFLAPFTEKWSGVCTIYPVRPLVCRLHYVSSDPAHCAPGSGEPVTVLDMTTTRKDATHVITSDDPLLSIHGPLPQFVAHAIRVLQGATPSLMDLKTWGLQLAKSVARHAVRDR